MLSTEEHQETPPKVQFTDAEYCLEMTVAKEPLLDVSPDYSRQLTLFKKNFADQHLSP